MVEKQFKTSIFLARVGVPKLGRQEESKAAFQKLDERNRAAEIPAARKGKKNARLLPNPSFS